MALSPRPGGPAGRDASEEEELHVALATGYTSPASGETYYYTREGAEEELRACEPVHRVVRDWCGAAAESGSMRSPHSARSSTV